jgi:hypothetical protein
MTDPNEKKLSDCGCCKDRLPQVRHHNRPGQPALVYRLGIHATFLRRMLAGLPFQEITEGVNQGVRPQAKLTTRERDDPSIAFLDAWATVADVLTFYQERIINEGYLRTATERRSVLELARAIGYELSPGVAASTYLAFTVEDAPGAPGVAIVPKGARVQSIPPQDKLPQTFETIEEITARAEWNSLKPRATRPQELVVVKSDTDVSEFDGLYLAGINSSFPQGTDNVISIPADWIYPINPTDVIDPDLMDVSVIEIKSIYIRGTNTNLKAGDLLLFVGKRGNVIKTVSSGIKHIQVDMELNIIRVDLDIGDDNIGPMPPRFKPPELKPAIVNSDKVDFDDYAVRKLIRGQKWYGSDLNAFLHMNNWNSLNLLTNLAALQALDVPHEDQGVFSFRQRLGFFGHNAPQHATLPLPDNTRGSSSIPPYDPYNESWDGEKEPSIWKNSQGHLNMPADVYLERSLPELLRGSWVIFQTGVMATLKENDRGPEVKELQKILNNLGHSVEVDCIFGPETKQAVKNFQKHNNDQNGQPLEADGIVGPKTWWSLIQKAQTGAKIFRMVYRVNMISETSLSDYGLSSKVSGLRLKQPNGVDPVKNELFKVRKTTAYVQSESLELADLPIEDPVEDIEQSDQTGKGASSLMLDRLLPGLKVGQTLVLRGEQCDAPGVIRHEPVILEEIIHIGGYTTLYFHEKLHYRYVRNTVTLNANVALATHGETVHEVLGSGDGSLTNQRFVLKKPPLTYVPAITPSGAESTLEVRVNDVLWEEVPSLYGIDERSQNYIVRIDNDARAMLLFGDGKSGARLPSGTENAVAIYRSGIGMDGEVEAGSLTLLQTRPLGIREVTNPLPATGADDPEKLDKARTNAPRTVLTFDRIVSLQDFEDFTRSFAGIGKVKATVLWNGERRVVYLTVAGAHGKKIDDKLRNNLTEAIKASCDPFQPVEVVDFKAITFSIEAQILVEKRYIYEEVKTLVERALFGSFSFEKRNFGQPVTAAEILTIIQAVKGVTAVDLENLIKDNVNLFSALQLSRRPGMYLEQRMPAVLNVVDTLYVSKGQEKKEITVQSVLPPAILTANTARLKNGQIKLAELLLLNPTGITLKKLVNET